MVQKFLGGRGGGKQYYVRISNSFHHHYHHYHRSGNGSVFGAHVGRRTYFASSSALLASSSSLSALSSIIPMIPIVPIETPIPIPTKEIVIGILRETYDPWERRVPLTPNQCKELIELGHNNHRSNSAAATPKAKIKILIQPSKNRCYTDEQYRQVEAAGIGAGIGDGSTYDSSNIQVQEDLSTAGIILGVKRPKYDLDLGGLLSLHGGSNNVSSSNSSSVANNPTTTKTCLFFSHTMKGQPENMLLLNDILNNKIQLIDYEKICATAVSTIPPATTTGSSFSSSNDKSKVKKGVIKEKRIVAFGKYAGLAGTIDMLNILGERLLVTQGIATPFLHIPKSIQYSNLETAKNCIRRIGQQIRRSTKEGSGGGLGGMTEPIIIGITGGPNGNVYQGIKEILVDLIPNETISISALPNLVNNNSNSNSNNNHNNNNHKIYIVTPETKDLYVLRDNNNNNNENENENGRDEFETFNRYHFNQHPSHYKSIFAETIAPYITVLINGTYWDHSYPKLITKQDMHTIYSSGNKRLLIVSDISCDINGGIEFLDRTTTISSPYYQYDPIQKKEITTNLDTSNITNYSSGNNTITIMGVDILPTELPFESSEHFGNALLKHVLPDLINASTSTTTSTTSTTTDGIRAINGSSSNKQQVVAERKTTTTTFVDASKLSQSLKNALITTNAGTFTEKYKYLEPIMKYTIKQRQQQQKMHDSYSDSGGASMIISLDGHLFDSGLINQILDVLEISQCVFEFLECHVQCHAKSKAILKISITNNNNSADSNSNSNSNSMLEDVQIKINALVDAIPAADATFDRLDDNGGGSGAVVANKNNKAVLRENSGSNSGSGGNSGSGHNITTSSNGAVYVEDNNGSDKTVLLLGSGRVSKSVVSLLTGGGGGGGSDDTNKKLSMINNRKYNIIVASNDEDEARDVVESSLAGGASGIISGRYEKVDIMNGRGRLQELIVNESDIVVSLLPASMHTSIAELCIESNVNLVTASYVSNEMQQLHEKAKNAGIKILNEIGLDPGLDHCSAMQIINSIRDRGGKITSFKSVCGGLPSPEAALDNPLRYKFSWSPRGVISASQNDARYLLNGKLIEVLGKDLLANATPFEDKFWSNDFELECLPNRDSLHYQTTYGLEDANTVFRGTLRYRGFSSLMHVFKQMGFFDDSFILNNNSNDNESRIVSWDDVLILLNNHDSPNNGTRTIDEFILASANGNVEESIRARECLQWLGMSGNDEDISSRISNTTTVVDLFCQRLEERLEYGKSERDMVVMHHTIGAEFEDGTIEEHHSSLQAFGTEDTMTAMCKTVGYPAAVAADLILCGNLDHRSGVLLPTTKDIYEPILEAVKKEGIIFDEHVKIKEKGKGYT